MSDWQSKTYTVTVPANTTNHADDTVFGPSLFNILKIKVTQDTAGATFSLRTFKDAAHSKQLINLPLEVAPLYQPRDRTGGAPGTEGQEGRPFPYDDEDGLGELHTQWDNNDSADHVYTITVIYYELPLMSAGGGPTYRGAGSFLTSVALRGAGSGVVTIAAASAAGTWTWTVPTGAGTDQYGLITNGAGVSSWAAIVNSLSGTTNQIAASASTGTPTLSLAGPHNFTTQTVNGVVYGGGTGALQSTAQGAANSVLIGVGSGAPQFSTTPQVVRIGLGAAADATALINMNGTLVHGSGSGVTIGGTTITSLLNLNEGNLRLTTASIAKFIGFYQSATQDWTIQHNADRSLSIDSPGSRVLALNASGGVVTIQTDPGGSDALRVGGTVRALRLGLGAAADAAIPLLITYTGSIAQQITGGATGPNQIRINNTGGDVRLGVESSAGGTILANSTAYSAVLLSVGATKLHLGTNDTTALTIDASQNIGIGTIGPTFIGGYGGIHLKGRSSSNSPEFRIDNSLVTNGDYFSLLSDVTGSTPVFAIADSTATEYWQFKKGGSTVFTGVGPHAIGGATNGSSLRLTGSSAPSDNGSGDIGFLQDQTIAGQTSTDITGFYLNPTLTEAGSSVHVREFFASFGGTITNGAATATDAGVLDIRTFAAATGTTNATGIRAAAPTGGGTLNDVAKFLKSDGTTIVAQFKGSGAVLMPSLATAGVTETYAVCADVNFQLILDTTACLVSTELAKKNIRPLDMGLATVLALEPVAYFREDPGQNWNLFGEQIGFNANRAALVDERLITRQSQNGDIHSFRYAEYTAVLTHAIQEHHAMIKALELRLEALAA